MLSHGVWIDLYGRYDDEAVAKISMFGLSGSIDAIFFQIAELLMIGNLQRMIFILIQLSQLGTQDSTIVCGISSDGSILCNNK